MCAKKHTPELQMGTKWIDRFNNSYEITYTGIIAGHRFFHVKLNGKHIGEKHVPSSVRLIPEAEVLAMKR